MIRSSVIAVSLLLLMEIHSVNFRYEELNADLSVYVKREKTSGAFSVILFQKGKQIEIPSNGTDMSGSYTISNGKQISVDKTAEGEKYSISGEDSTYIFSVDNNGNIDISSEKQNVDTGKMSFAFRTDGIIKSSNPILFNSLFLCGNKIENNSILKTRNYTFYYKTFDNYGIFDSRKNDSVNPEQFASRKTVLLQKLQEFKRQSHQSSSSIGASASSSSAATASSSTKNSKNNYGIMLNDYVGYSGSALQVNSYGLTECDSMHFGGTDSELSVKRGKFLVHGAISGTFKSTGSIKIEEGTSVHVHRVNVRFVEGLQQVQRSPQPSEFVTTLNKMGLALQEKQHTWPPTSTTVNLTTPQTMEYSPLWRWNFKGDLNASINQDLLLGAGFSLENLKRRKWHCEDEELMIKEDYRRVKQEPIEVRIPGVPEPVKLFLVTTGAGGGNSCGFLSLTKKRDTVYSTEASSPSIDLCRHNIIQQLIEAIDGKHEDRDKEKVLELIAPQLMKYISTNGNATYNYEQDKYEWEDAEESIWNDIEKVFLSEISGISVEQLESSENNKTRVANSKREHEAKEEELNRQKREILSQIKNKILEDISFIDSLNLSDDEMSRQFTKKTKKEIIAITEKLYRLEIQKGDTGKDPIIAGTLHQAVEKINSTASDAGTTNLYSVDLIKKFLTIHTSDNEQLQSIIMRFPTLQNQFMTLLEQLKRINREIMKLYQLPETMKAYLNKFLNRTGIQLEVTGTETTGVLQAIAYIQKSSLVLVADKDYTIDKVRMEFHKKGEVLIFYDNPDAESVIYAFVHPGHYSKAVTEEQCSKAKGVYESQ